MAEAEQDTQAPNQGLLLLLNSSQEQACRPLIRLLHAARQSLLHDLSVLLRAARAAGGKWRRLL